MNPVKSISSFLFESRNKKQKEEVKEGISILDKIAQTNEEENKEKMIESFVKDFVRPNGPCIYAFVTDKVQDAIKVGYTDQHPEKRIAQWKEIYGKDAGEVTCLGYWSSEEFNAAGERVFFWDHAIHQKIRDKGYKQLSEDDFMATLTDKGRKVVDIHYSREFFDKYKRLITGDLDPDDKEELSEVLIEDIIKQMRANIKAGTEDFKLYKFDEEGKTTSKLADTTWGDPDSYTNTELQEEAIKNGIQAIKDGKKNILMAAVMRFGKTHATYEIIKGAGLKRVVVCSAKADVRTAWREDINHIHFYKDFVFIEVLDQYKWDITHYKNDKLVTEHKNVYDGIIDEYKDKTIIFFFTLHDLGGSISGLKQKHKKLFDEEFDLMVVDETHYGSHANTFGKVTKLNRNIEDDDNSDIEEEQKLAKESEETLKQLNIKYKSILQVSGTPYYILASNEMIQEDAEIISKVSYSDMLNARDKWNKEHSNEDPSNSPYFGIPTLHKIGLRLSKDCRKVLKEHGITDSLSELFKVKAGKFDYENEVKGLMKSIFGDGSDNSLAFLKNKSVEGNKVCKHTLIVLPRIEACQVMKQLLSTFINTKEREIFCIVGKEGKIQDVKDVDDLNNKLEKLDNSGKKSIILTVNRFLTGVSMPCVDSMIYLKNASSPQEYDQNIFRLCTRRVKKVSNLDNKSRSKKVNMKDNVYLIDFNIGNMFNMLANSAKMKAAAEGDPRAETIEKYMKQDLGATPIFCEDKGGKEILGKMHEITSKDLMEIYTKYNKNKSISDMVNDDIDLFDKMFINKKFQDIISNLEIDGDKSKLSLDVNDEDGEDLDNIGQGSTGQEKDEKKTLKEYIKSKEDRTIFLLTKEKFKAITKNLLYCNICLDEPCMDLEEIIKRSKEDNEFKNMLGEFKISLGDLYKAYKLMSTNYQQAYNNLLTRMALLAHDLSIGDYEKFSTAIRGLGRLDKNEVVTPPEVVEKMINKLDKSNYEKAESILLVNEKQAEFFMGIYKKFGKKIAEKCKIVASSEIGKHLCKKMLKSAGVKDYINNIMNINDVNGDGKYNVNDFLDMKNEEILKENNNKRFSIIIQNPPYGSIGGDTLHLKFVNKCLDLANKQIAIFPFTFVTKINNKPSQKYKELFSKYLKSIEEVASKEFKGTAMPNVGIYVFDSNKKENEKITIQRLNQDNKQEINSLTDISEFTDYEKEIIKYLENNGTQLVISAGRVDKRKKELEKISKDKHKEFLDNKIIQNCSLLKKYLNNEYSVGLVINQSNGAMNGKAINSKNGQIYDNYYDFENLFLSLRSSSGYNVILFKSIKQAQNCKIALQNSLLRFTIYKLQDDQNMYPKIYKYIPAIDWSDDRVKTDEGLLEVCGCPKDKCKEYAEYCKKIIDKVDKK